MQWRKIYSIERIPHTRCILHSEKLARQTHNRYFNTPFGKMQICGWNENTRVVQGILARSHFNAKLCELLLLGCHFWSSVKTIVPTAQLLA